jgi:hypothetical protein
MKDVSLNAILLHLTEDILCEVSHDNYPQRDCELSLRIWKTPEEQQKSEKNPKIPTPHPACFLLGTKNDPEGSSLEVKQAEN